MPVPPIINVFIVKKFIDNKSIPGKFWSGFNYVNGFKKGVDDNYFFVNVISNHVNAAVKFVLVGFAVWDKCIANFNHILISADTADCVQIDSV